MSDSDDSFITIQTLHAVCAPAPVEESELEIQNRELKAYSDRQFKALKVANKLIGELQTKIEHLQELLADSVPLVRQIQVSNEQAIVEIQIEKLRDDAMMRQLSLDETKRLDILIRSLHAIKAKQADSINARAIPISEKFSDAQLLTLVAKPVELPKSDESNQE